MIGDINNLDWMDFEKLEDDITLGSSIGNDRWFLVIKYRIKSNWNIYSENIQCFFQAHKNDKKYWISVFIQL